MNQKIFIFIVRVKCTLKKTVNVCGQIKVHRHYSSLIFISAANIIMIIKINCNNMNSNQILFGMVAK